jgi:hypothetical protein
MGRPRHSFGTLQSSGRYPVVVSLENAPEAVVGLMDKPWCDALAAGV